MEELSRYYTSADWKQTDDWGWTLLHEVAHNGQADIIQVRVTQLRVLCNSDLSGCVTRAAS